PGGLVHLPVAPVHVPVGLVHLRVALVPSPCASVGHPAAPVPSPSAAAASPSAPVPSSCAPELDATGACLWSRTLPVTPTSFQVLPTGEPFLTAALSGSVDL